MSRKNNNKEMLNHIKESLAGTTLALKRIEENFKEFDKRIRYL